jgi:predicted metal-dependent HD superfamily phosphohydrolase
MADLDLERWKALLCRLGARSGIEMLYDRLRGSYAEAHRTYHTFHHVRDCLAQLDKARHIAEHPFQVEAALWFHDVICDPRAKDNEEQSAWWAECSLRKAGVSCKVALNVSKLILATRHRDVPSDADAALVVDIDLSILGRMASVFDEYERQIRQEYDYLSDAVFRKGRTAILRGFAARKVIYQTQFFRDRYEVPARENLARSICRLGV